MTARNPLVLALLLSMAGCAAKNATAETTANESRIRVQTVAVTEALVADYVLLTGSLRGDRQAQLAANAMGKVLATNVERGTEVKAGDVIAQLDTRTASLTAQEARVGVSLAETQQLNAQRECERAEKLHASNAISGADYDRTMDQCRLVPISLEQAQVRARNAAQMVWDGNIRAPFDGMVVERSINVGEFVRQDTRVATLVTIDKLRLEFNVPELQVGFVKNGAVVKFRVPAFPGKSFEGTVRYVAPSLREQTRDLVAEAQVDNQDRTLRPGMFAEVQLQVGATKRPMIPATAVRMKDGRAHVFLVVDKRITERVLQVGEERDGQVPVLSGLATGDALIAAMTPEIRNGQGVL